MVEKELLTAVASYNLVRAIIYRAARQAGLRPREFSFSAAQDAVMAALGWWLAAGRGPAPQFRFKQVLDNVK
jgi:hypothetical protein